MPARATISNRFASIIHRLRRWMVASYLIIDAAPGTRHPIVDSCVCLHLVPIRPSGGMSEVACNASRLITFMVQVGRDPFVSPGGVCGGLLGALSPTSRVALLEMLQVGTESMAI